MPDWNGTTFTLPSYDVIPANASTDNLYFAFEVYDAGSDYNNDGTGFQGFLRYQFWYTNKDPNAAGDPDVQFDNFDWVDYDKGTFTNPYGKLLQDVNGDVYQQKWYRHTTKLSDMTAFKGKTYKDIVNTGLGMVRIMSLSYGAKSGNVDVYIDNIRLVYIP
jgi:hypothetical protein